MLLTRKVNCRLVHRVRSCSAWKS